VLLCHGYASHTIFDWFLPASSGEPHDSWDGTVLQGFVGAGYLVCAVDHQSHGRSQGSRGLRAYFDDFDDLAQEVIDYVTGDVLSEQGLRGLPIFALGESMGGAVVVHIAQLAPELLRGAVLYAPMLSLERVSKEKVLCCIRNVDLEPFANFLDCVVPTAPIAKGAKNTMYPDSQHEFDEDPLNYSGSVRVRAGKAFSEVTKGFMSGGLREMRTPFVTFHSDQDTFTDPAGSEALVSMAECQDKTYVRVGRGLDIDVDIWHGLSTEPGHAAVFKEALAWISMRT